MLEQLQEKQPMTDKQFVAAANFFLSLKEKQAGLPIVDKAKGQVTSASEKAGVSIAKGMTPLAKPKLDVTKPAQI